MPKIVHNPKSGQTDLPTLGYADTDPALVQMQVSRLSALVDDLVERSIEPKTTPLTSSFEHDFRWAVRERLDVIERHSKTRDEIALVLLLSMMVWASIVTVACVSVLLYVDSL